jgi:hypothetical protein
LYKSAEIQSNNQGGLEMNNKLRLLGAVFAYLLTFGLSNTAAGASVNVDFGSSGGTPTNTFGAVGEIGSWNKILLGTTGNLFDTDRLVTSVSISVAASTSTGSAATPTNNNDSVRLLFDNFYSIAAGTTQVADWTVDFTGLDNGLTRLILYAPSNTAVSTGLMTVNGTGVSELTGSATAEFIDGTSYRILHANVTDGTLSLSGTTLGSTYNYAGLAGIQISSVPIPPALWLFGAGLLGLAGIARRRNPA